jgi:dTDP-4-amino-4,6-dideoxygalactose transaminase
MQWGAAVGRSRTIALPAFCCYDLVTAVNAAGLNTVLYDIEPETLAPEFGSLETALAGRPAALVVAHLYGVPVDMPAVMDLAERFGVPVIEDAAQAAGAMMHGRPAGSFGHLRVLSFGRGKGVTGGRGGALLVDPGWRGSSIASPGHGARGLLELAALLSQWLLARPGLYRIPASIPAFRLGDTVYQAPHIPAGQSAVSAAVAEVTWARREREAASRRRNAEWLLTSLFRTHSLVATRPGPGAQPGWLRLPVLARGLDRADPRFTAARALGVMPGYPRPLGALSELPCPAAGRDFPGARELAARLWTLPTHSLLTQPDLERLGEWISRFSD